MSLRRREVEMDLEDETREMRRQREDINNIVLDDPAKKESEM